MGGECSRIARSVIEVVSPSICPIPDSDSPTSKYEILGSKHWEIDPCSDGLYCDDEFTTAESGDICLSSPNVIDGSTDRPDDRIDEEGTTLCRLIRTRIADDLVESVFPEG